MQVARIRVEHGHLLLSGPDNTRMTMSHVRNVVVSIQVLSPCFVKQILPPAANDFDRIAITDAQVAANALTASLECFGLA
jgi:hypothetical protein